MPRFSVVEYFGCDDSGHQCGYCKGKKTSLTIGMWAHQLKTDDYQDLIDRGWRRSGKYVYKSIMDKTCCPMYTIRCQALDFKPSKSHKKQIKKFRNYIIHDRRPGKDEAEENDTAMEDQDKVTTPKESHIANNDSDILDDAEKKLKMNPDTNLTMSKVTSCVADDKKDVVSLPQQQSESSSNPPQIKRTKSDVNKKSVRQGEGPDPNRPKARKAKDIRREKALLKGKSEMQKKADKNREKTLEDLINEPFPPESKHKFEVRTILAQTSHPPFMNTYEETLLVYQKYQVKVHGDEKDECKSSQFKRFLCDSSLTPQSEVPTSMGHGRGGFHQQYLIDGKIVAVGVVDILRDCLSSVYLFYDPDYSFLSFGTLSALFEIAYTRKMQSVWPELKYYYMGFYIHSCPKMRYKAQYSHSYLLCPETYRWVKWDDRCSKLLDETKYSKLYNTSEDGSDAGDSTRSAGDLSSVLILHERQAMTFNMYNEWRSCEISREVEDGFSIDRDDTEIKEYVKMVGHHLSQKMLLYRA